MVLEDHYSLLMSVWLPDVKPEAAAAALTKALTKQYGAQGESFTVIPLVATKAAAGAPAAATVTRRLQLACPQKPGVVLAVTNLLQVRTAQGRPCIYMHIYICIYIYTYKYSTLSFTVQMADF